MVGEVSVGTVQFADGEFTASATYTHDGSETTSDSFTYKAKDSEDGPESNEATANISIGAVNNAPLAQDIVLPQPWDETSCDDPQVNCIAEGALVTVTLTATDAEAFTLIPVAWGPCLKSYNLLSV